MSSQVGAAVGAHAHDRASQISDGEAKNREITYVVFYWVDASHMSTHVYPLSVSLYVSMAAISHANGHTSQISDDVVNNREITYVMFY